MSWKTVQRLFISISQSKQRDVSNHVLQVSVLRLTGFNIFSDALMNDYSVRLLNLHIICSWGQQTIWNLIAIHSG